MKMSTPKTLIVAEKPSVAKDIARALGGFKPHGDYLERDDLIVTSALGHLAGLDVPEAAAGASLPIIPAQFGVAPIDEDAKKRIKLIGSLAIRKEVTRIVNACDAGRVEGLIYKTYASRDGKQIIPTDRGVQVISHLGRLGLGKLTAAKLTGEWEHRLTLVDRGQESRDIFMAGIGDFTRHMVDVFTQEQRRSKPPQSPHACPDCGFPMFLTQGYRPGTSWWGCSNYPACKTKCADNNGKPGDKKESAQVSSEHRCPDCGKGLVFRRGVSKKGPWKMWGCSGYPGCASKFDDAGGKPVLERAAS
jgi:predicted RNA-binding Zn-ribbon protein involved in translation (DUF1610 family)